MARYGHDAIREFFVNELCFAVFRDAFAWPSSHVMLILINDL